MNAILHKNTSRGQADHGWLNSRHTFSFADYHNPERTHFGVLRVINDDIVRGGYGFSSHPHKNMEIVSIPLKGALEHKDSTGRHKIIRESEVQIMSAGSGIVHSEYNASKEEEINFLQIWIIPDKQNIDPRYDQKLFSPEDRQNKLLNVVAPDNSEALWINQQAWFYLGKFEQGKTHSYTLNNPQNGIYIFMISGEMEVDDYFLESRDGLAISQIEEEVTLIPSGPCEYLLMEVKMKP